MDIGQKMSLDLQYNFFVSVEQVVASGVVGVISWRRPFTLVVCTVSSQHDLLSVSICLLVFSFCSDVIFVSFRCRCSCCCLQCVWFSVWLVPCCHVRMHRWSNLMLPVR